MAGEDKPFWNPPTQDAALVPFRRAFDAARDPQAARNALGILDTGGGGTPAPVDAEYITAVDDPTLTNDRALTDTATVTWDFSTPGQAKANATGGGGGGNVSNSGTPTVNQYARWVTSTTIMGVAPSTVLTDIGAQPLDGDLTALAALSGTNVIYYRSAANTWTAVTIGSGLSFTLGILSASGSGGGNVTTVGLNSAGQYARWTASLDIEGVAPATVLSDIGAQPLDGDLTALAGLTGTNTIYYRSAANTWTAVVVGGNLSFSGGTLNTAITPQPLDATLTALAAYNTNGLLTQTAADTFTGRTLTGPAAGITVSNGNGVAGNPTLALANDLAALEALAGTNTIYYRSAADTWTAVTIGGNLSFSGGTLNATADAPVGAEYITSTTDATLTAERVLTDTATVTWDRSVAGQIKANASTGAGATTTPVPPQGRLTLQTATPVMITTQSAKTTIFYTPYKGNQVPLYNGTDMVMTAFAEISTTTTDTTKNPAAIGASKVNDWFIWSDSGTVRICHGPDWTSDTARSAGTALVMVNGILLNNAAITNGPAASRGTYVGTTRSNASSQLDWIFGALAVGGTAGFFGVWNAYNRAMIKSMVADTTDTWSYSTNAWRSVRAVTTMRHSFVSGLAEDAFSARHLAVSNGVAGNGIGFDVTNNFSGTAGYVGNLGGAVASALAEYGTSALGFHFFQAVEYSYSGPTTFNGDDSLAIRSGLWFEGLM